MQIIESTAFGVRSAIMRLEAEDQSPAFELYPMLHVAAPDFYAEVSRRLETCDVILFEGVKSRTSRSFDLMYRFLDCEHLGLVYQKTMRVDHLTGRRVHADVDGEEFDRRWWRIKAWLPFLVILGAPLLGLYLRCLGTREDIARHMTLNLRTSRDDILKDDDERRTHEVIHDWRDRHLIEVIEEERGNPDNAGKTIAIVYGARHMRAVIRHLIDEPGYRVTKAEWVTVFTL